MYEVPLMVDFITYVPVLKIDKSNVVSKAFGRISSTCCPRRLNNVIASIGCFAPTDNIPVVGLG